MATILDARKYVGAGLPATNGAGLAGEVLKTANVPWSDLVIDARSCPPDYLNSAFFNAFWQHLYEAQPQRLEEAKAIRWEFTHPFQKASFDFLRAHFKPRNPA